jgi:fructose-bisphosphate aldolase / 6-deoxy-5-ketofructose 1-phosphate synthase
MRLFKQKIDINVPADVPIKLIDIYMKNYHTITRGTNRLVLFSCDQKIEHLNNDFYGPGIPAEDNDPQHLFQIAEYGDIGAMAAQLGLISRYAKYFKNINYIAKLNSKTNLVKTDQQEPLNKQLWSIKQVHEMIKETNLPLCGIGLTVYLGSEYEAEMLSQAAKAVFEAHKHGLITILWMYPRGKSVSDEKDGHLIAGAAGVANALGSDFAKINPPQASDNKSSEQWLAIAAQAAGNTKLLCAGGKTVDPDSFLKELYEQIHIGHTSGNATGRNIHQKTHAQAIAFTKAIAAIVYNNKTVEDAKKLLI